MLTDKQLHDAKQKLKARFLELRDIVRDELLNSEQQNYIELAGKVHDVDEESVADLLVDLQLASIDRHIDEIREIDAALIRIAEHSYGICTDCDAEIDAKRLAARPTAQRCYDCQSRFEKSHARPSQASL